MSSFASQISAEEMIPLNTINGAGSDQPALPPQPNRVGSNRTYPSTTVAAPEMRIVIPIHNRHAFLDMLADNGIAWSYNQIDNPDAPLTRLQIQLLNRNSVFVPVPQDTRLTNGQRIPLADRGAIGRTLHGLGMTGMIVAIFTCGFWPLVGLIIYAAIKLLEGNNPNNTTASPPFDVNNTNLF